MGSRPQWTKVPCVSLLSRQWPGTGGAAHCRMLVHTQGSCLNPQHLKNKQTSRSAAGQGVAFRGRASGHLRTTGVRGDEAELDTVEKAGVVEMGPASGSCAPACARRTLGCTLEEKNLILKYLPWWFLWQSLLQTLRAPEGKMYLHRVSLGPSLRTHFPSSEPM